MDRVRSIVGVALGYAVFVVGSFMPRSAAAEHPGQPTVGLVAGCIGYGVVFAALAGLTAASIAGRRYAAHALVLAGLIAVSALLHLWLQPGADPWWLDLSAALVMAPAAAIAGWARGRLPS